MTIKKPFKEKTYTSSLTPMDYGEFYKKSYNKYIKLSKTLEKILKSIIHDGGINDQRMDKLIENFKQILHLITHLPRKGALLEFDEFYKAITKFKKKYYKKNLNSDSIYDSMKDASILWDYEVTLRIYTESMCLPFL